MDKIDAQIIFGTRKIKINNMRTWSWILCSIKENEEGIQCQPVHDLKY